MNLFEELTRIQGEIDVAVQRAREEWRLSQTSVQPSDRVATEESVAVLFPKGGDDNPIFWVPSPLHGQILLGIAHWFSKYNGDTGLRDKKADFVDFLRGFRWGFQDDPSKVDYLEMRTLWTPEFREEIVELAIANLKEAWFLPRTNAFISYNTLDASRLSLMSSSGNGWSTTDINVTMNSLGMVTQPTVARQFSLCSQRLLHACGSVIFGPHSRYTTHVSQYTTQAPFGNVYDMPNTILFYKVAKGLGQEADSVGLARATLSEQTGGYWITPKFTMIAERPTVIHADDQGRLHREDGPAIEYGDHVKAFFWHGISMNRQYFEHRELITADKVVKEQNIELSRTFMEMMGMERFVDEAKPQILDVDVDGTGQKRRLLRIGHKASFVDPVVICEVNCPSTGSRYLLSVPPNTQTCAAAIAWTFGLSVDQYNPVREQ